jgi:hypothetical protein
MGPTVDFLLGRICCEFKMLHYSTPSVALLHSQNSKGLATIYTTLSILDMDTYHL